jgi:hypothetical protein
MFKRLMFLILCLAMLVGMGLATTAAIAGDGMYGEMRYRWEGLKNFDDWSSNNDDNFGFAHVRSRLGYSTEIGERGLFNMSVQNTRVMGNDGSYGVPPVLEGDSRVDNDEDTEWVSNDNNAVLLNEGYLGITDFLLDGFDIYAGRFAAAYGRERVIGAEEWAYNSEIRFDGFKGHYVFEKGWADLICLKLRENLADKYSHHEVGHWEMTDPLPPEVPERVWVDNYRTDPGDLDLRGIYAHYDVAEGMYIEPYILMTSQDNAFQYMQLEDDLYKVLKNDNYLTFGALFDYMSDTGLHFYAEGLMKSGTTHVFATATGLADDSDISTLGFYTGLFYEFESTLRPFIGAEFNYASGSKNADDVAKKDKTFDSPFGSHSSYMGIMDLVDWSNTATIRLSGGLTPIEGTDVKLDFFMFKLATDEDEVSGGKLSKLPDAESVNDIYPSKNVGTEIDFFVNHKIEDGVSLEGGLAMFSFGDYFGTKIAYDSLLYGWLGAKVEF